LALALVQREFDKAQQRRAVAVGPELVVEAQPRI